MSAGDFEKLHPAIQYHVVNSLGWASLRPQQAEAIEPVLAGRDCLVLAPTAGGKTEAAIIPVLSRMLDEEWRGLSVLYVCPIKALLNNLEERLSRYAGLVGRAVQVWHGDVSQSAKAKALREPPDILLTTPESLEGMLISLRVDRAAWFSALRVAIVDELHAFAGDDRGWHLRAVLGRLQAFTPHRVQRIGLSATVGNPEALLGWFSGNTEGCVVGSAGTSRDADVTIDDVGNLDNAATVISRLHRGSKRLVFCDSRARVEELAAGLRRRDVRTFVSHSSLSASERKQAEQAFSQDPDCVIVATSTLELGIDVGDLDYVIQIDAPSTVSSFLQRMGRTGRRSGTLRNCLFLTTTEEAFLIACGLVRLWKQGFVEPVVPPSEPWHLVAQQVMALALQSNGITRGECTRMVSALFPELNGDGVRDLVAYMAAEDILSESEGLLGFGERGEQLYGRRHFLDLLSVFASPIQMMVRHGASDLGHVDPVSLAGGNDEERILLLGGHSWRVTSVDWSKRLVWVEPTAREGKARWFGSSRSLGFELCQAIKHVLCGSGPDEALSRRGAETLVGLRQALSFLDRDRTTVEHLAGGRMRWWTFAGGRVNWLLAHLYRGSVRKIQCDDLQVTWTGAFDYADFVERFRAADRTEISKALLAAKIVEPKFARAVTPELLARQSSARGIDWGATEAILAEAPLFHTDYA